MRRRWPSAVTVSTEAAGITERLVRTRLSGGAGAATGNPPADPISLSHRCPPIINLKFVDRAPPKKMNTGEMSTLEMTAKPTGCRDEPRKAPQLATKKPMKTSRSEAAYIHFKKPYRPTFTSISTSPNQSNRNATATKPLCVQ